METSVVAAQSASRVASAQFASPGTLVPSSLSIRAASRRRAAAFTPNSTRTPRERRP